ncbi:head-tail connector protein [Bacillus cihuensis]|uniref:head-tail connector protein n=1 Tax=Bacillus cihuensis TaxID=1208599 RepID=UPI00040C9755|nr:head-tail connector protein [Bacillus cihuensis]
MKITELDLDFVKRYLRIEHSEDDMLLEMMITASKSFIQNYLNQTFEEMGEVPAELTIPALAIIAHWYEKREVQVNDRVVKEILYSFSGILDMFRIFKGGQIL